MGRTLAQSSPLRYSDKIAQQTEADLETTFTLGIFYATGQNGFPQDEEKALYWFHQLARQGHPNANLMILLTYERHPEYRDSLQRIIKAAGEGDSIAKTLLSHMYGQVSSEPADTDTSANSGSCWFGHNRAQGPDSQFSLGILYQHGVGIPQDQGQALYWFTLAAQQGHPEAAAALKQLDQQLDQNPLK